MSNDMKLIMESWRRNVLLEQTPPTPPPSQEQMDLDNVLARWRQDAGQFDPNAMTVGDMLSVFSGAAVKAMIERHSAVKAFIKILLDATKLINDYQQGLGDGDKGYSKDDVDKLLDIIKEVQDFFEDLSAKLEQVEQESTGGWVNTFLKKVTASVSQACLKFPVDAIKDIMENKLFQTVAANLGFAAALQGVAEIIPLGGIALKGIKSLQAVAGWMDEDSDVQKAIKARKNPEDALKLMTTAAMTVDDSKKDLMGPLATLDIDDSYQQVIDKKVLAEFISKWVQILKSLDRNTRLNKLASQDYLERFVNTKYKVKVRKT